MPLEDICALEALLCLRSRSRTETADNGRLVVSCNNMSITVVFPREACVVIRAAGNRAWIRSSRLWLEAELCSDKALQELTSSMNVLIDVPPSLCRTCRNQDKGKYSWYCLMLSICLSHEERLKVGCWMVIDFVIAVAGC